MSLRTHPTYISLYSYQLVFRNDNNLHLRTIVNGRQLNGQLVCIELGPLLVVNPNLLDLDAANGQDIRLYAQDIVLEAVHLRLEDVSAEDVSQYSIISEVALGFIALAMGNEFRLEDLKKTGKKAVVVAVIQAVAATALVDAAQSSRWG